MLARDWNSVNINVAGKITLKRLPILPQGWDVPQIFRDRLGDDYGRQRIMFHEGHLLLVLHAPPKPNQNVREGRVFWRKPNGDWAAKDGGGFAALKKHFLEFENVLEACEQQGEVAESPREYFSAIEGLTPIQRTASNLYQVMQEARKTVSEDRSLILLRDEAYQLSRRADLEFASAKNGLEFSMAKKTEEQADATYQMSVASHRLNLLASFFFPIVTVASIFGTGLIQVDQNDAWATLAGLMLFGLICGAILTFFVTRKHKRKK